MRISPLFAPLIAFVLSPAVHGINIEWFTARSCNGGATQTYRNVPCNTCNTPPFGYNAVRISENGPDNRITLYSKNYCSYDSQIGQWYGNTCIIAGTAALRSVYVACPGQDVDASNTTSAASNISYISYKGDANDTSVTDGAGDANDANDANV